MNTSLYISFAPEEESKPGTSVVSFSLVGADFESFERINILYKRAKLLSWKEVALRFKTSWDTIYFSLKRVVDYGLEHRDLSMIESIGVYEIANRQRT